MKKFWKKTEGFTLVELVVVIAILGILAGVGTVGYSGYVKKANMAADEALLNELNTAFASACALNGESHIAREDEPELIVNNNIVTGLNLEDKDKIVAAFDTFFEGEEKAFRVLDAAQLMYNKVTGSFALSASQVFEYLGKNFNVLDKDREALLNSIFGNSEKFEAGEIVNRVDSVVDFAADKVSSNALLANLVTADAFKDVFAGMYPDVNIDSATEDQKMSALVVYTAKNSQNLSSESMLSILQNGSGMMGDYLSRNENSVAGDTEDAAMIAMHYAVGMAWAKETGKTYNTPEDLFALFGEHTDDPSIENDFNPQPKNEFKEWLNSAEGAATAKDAMDGYLAAMNIIGSNAGSITGESLYDNNGNYIGFGQYEELINQVLGR